MNSKSLVIVTSCVWLASLPALRAADPRLLASQQGSPAPKAPAATTQTPRPTAPAVREISVLVLDKKTKGQGLFKISGAPDGCSPTSFEGVIAAPGFAARGPNAFIALLFLQGVRHEIQGEVCWPSADLDYRIEGNMGADQVTKNGRFVSTGSINGRGKIIIAGANEPGSATHSKVFRIRSSSSQPLVFSVSTTGYRYVSGQGTVTTPTGQTFSFPK